MVRHRRLSFILRFKVIPTVLRNVSDAGLYSDLVSKVTVGNTYKTTSFLRHKSSDDKIIEIISKSRTPEDALFADIGVSDGSGSMYLVDALGSMNIRSVLFDKYAGIRVIKKWYGKQYINLDGEIMSVKICCFYCYCAPFKIKVGGARGEMIRLVNPMISERDLDIEYFDIFSTESSLLFNFVKIANVLNLAYFHRQRILDGLRNLYKSIADGGRLFIIHNRDDSESLLVLRKVERGFAVEHAGHDPELLCLAEDQCIRLD